MTFTEVLFAVILLGLGFIMLAGMFPIAISQTQSNVDETAAANVAQSAVKVLQQNMTLVNTPPTGTIGSSVIMWLRFGEYYDQTRSEPVLDIGRWNAISGSLISSNDARYAWTPLYYRDSRDSFARVIILVAKSRNNTAFVRPSLDGSGNPNPSDVTRWSASGSVQPANLEPRLMRFIITRAAVAGEPDTIKIDQAYNGGTGAFAVVEGAYLVVSSVPAAGGFRPSTGTIYRIGNVASVPQPAPPAPPDTWELLPGSDLASSGVAYGATSPFLLGYVMGKSYEDLNTPPLPPPGGGGNFAGYAQDVTVFSTVIMLK